MKDMLGMCCENRKYGKIDDENVVIMEYYSKTNMDNKYVAFSEYLENCSKKNVVENIYYLYLHELVKTTIEIILIILVTVLILFLMW